LALWVATGVPRGVRVIIEFRLIRLVHPSMQRFVRRDADPRRHPRLSRGISFAAFASISTSLMARATTRHAPRDAYQPANVAPGSGVRFG
jgi:hypothetical protein